MRTERGGLLDPLDIPAFQIKNYRLTIIGSDVSGHPVSLIPIVSGI